MPVSSERRSRGPKQPDLKSCALFARYSSKMQGEMSLDAQVCEMEAFCKREGLVIVDRYLMPEVRSADLDKSAEFCRMLEDVKARQWKVLLCHKLDRLGRDRDMVVMFKAALRKKGVEIRSVVENLSDSTEHRMLEQIFEVFSDFYARNLGNETRKGHRQLVRQGFWKGGPPAWGLVSEAVDAGGKKPRKRLAVCPVRGPIMAEVFARVAQGDPPERVRRWVANKTSDEEWLPQAFYARIHNPIYYGRLEYGRTSLPAGRPRKTLNPEEVTIGDWGGQVVSKELWDRAQAVVAAGSRKHVRRQRIDSPYLLTGLIRCAECGSGIIGAASSGHRKYRCIDRKCTNRTCRAEALETAVLAGLRELLEGISEKDVIRDVASQLEPLRADSRAFEADLHKQLSECRVRKRRLFDAVEQGGSAELYIERIKELAGQESALSGQLDEVQSRVKVAAGFVAREFLGKWQDLKQNLSDEPDRESLRLALRLVFNLQLKFVWKDSNNSGFELTSVCKPHPMSDWPAETREPVLGSLARIMKRRMETNQTVQQFEGDDGG